MLTALKDNLPQESDVGKLTAVQKWPAAGFTLLLSQLLCEAIV
jgi:hypothetical protein